MKGPAAPDTGGRRRRRPYSAVRLSFLDCPNATLVRVTNTPLPPASSDPRTVRLAELCAIMERLRDKDVGCPWDLKQTLATLVPYLREELGDLLFNVVFTVELAREKGWFSMADVVEGAAAKIRRRHPHIFGDLEAKTPEEVETIWRRVKEEEKAEKEKKRARRTT